MRQDKALVALGSVFDNLCRRRGESRVDYRGCSREIPGWERFETLNKYVPASERKKHIRYILQLKTAAMYYTGLLPEDAGGHLLKKHNDMFSNMVIRNQLLEYLLNFLNHIEDPSRSSYPRLPPQKLKRTPHIGLLIQALLNIKPVADTYKRDKHNRKLKYRPCLYLLPAFNGDIRALKSLSNYLKDDANAENIIQSGILGLLLSLHYHAWIRSKPSLSISLLFPSGDGVPDKKFTHTAEERAVFSRILIDVRALLWHMAANMPSLVDTFSQLFEQWHGRRWEMDRQHDFYIWHDEITTQVELTINDKMYKMHKSFNANARKKAIEDFGSRAFKLIQEITHRISEESTEPKLPLTLPSGYWFSNHLENCDFGSQVYKVIQNITDDIGGVLTEPSFPRLPSPRGTGIAIAKILCKNDTPQVKVNDLCDSIKALDALIKEILDVDVRALRISALPISMSRHFSRCPHVFTNESVPEKIALLVLHVDNHDLIHHLSALLNIYKPQHAYHRDHKLRLWMACSDILSTFTTILPLARLWQKKEPTKFALLFPLLELIRPKKYNFASIPYHDFDFKEIQRYGSTEVRDEYRAVTSVHETLVTSHTIKEFNHYSIEDIITASEDDANHHQMIDAGVVDILMQMQYASSVLKWDSHRLKIAVPRAAVFNMLRSFNLLTYSHRIYFLLGEQNICTSHKFGHQVICSTLMIQGHIKRIYKFHEREKITIECARIGSYQWPSLLRSAYWEKSTRYPKTSQYIECIRKESTRRKLMRANIIEERAKTRNRVHLLAPKEPTKDPTRDPTRDPCGLFVQKRKPPTSATALLEPQSDQAQPRPQIRTPRLSIPAYTLSAHTQSSMTLRDEKKGSTPAVFKRR